MKRLLKGTNNYLENDLCEEDELMKREMIK